MKKLWILIVAVFLMNVSVSHAEEGKQGGHSAQQGQQQGGAQQPSQPPAPQQAAPSNPMAACANYQGVPGAGTSPSYPH